jgi:hypothetical protein
MSGERLAITERDRAILREIHRFGVMSREQFVRLGLFASKTRANERLRRLVEAGHLTTRRQPLAVGGPRHVYLPGRHCVDSGRTRKRFAGTSDLFLLHQLGLVDIRLAFEGQTSLTRWLSDTDLRPLNLGLVPDGFIEYDVDTLTYCAFIEYDRGTETLGHIERKVASYIDLARFGRFEQTFNRRFFRVCVIVDSTGRLATLSQAVRRITDRIVRLTTLSQLTANGPLGAIWRKPGGDVSESLTSS